MKYSYNWLKEISGTKKSAEELAKILTMHSFELDGIETKGDGLENIVVGEILDIQKHPNADRLQLTKIDIGTKELDIVCGANNIKVGDKIPVALVGAVLPGISAKGGPASGWEIKEAEIRGVKSFGMLCAEDELGLGKDHSGILILEKNAKIGASIKEALGLNDTVIDLDVLSNRGHDALSHWGMAKEISSLENKKANTYYDKLKITGKKSGKVKVEVKDENLCPRYIGAVMNNIKIQESPEWIKNKLLALGMNPISNIVDATNYVMLELGQPLHAFDIEKIKGEKIIIRKAERGEKIKLLDETTKELDLEDLVIADSEKVLAVAGVMGGEDSGINEFTTSIVLESANFNQTSIRKTRMRLGIKTDASDRFEKGIDPNLAETAIARIVEIIEKMGGKLEGYVDIYPKKIKPWKINLDLNYVNKLLGENISQKQITEILNLLGIETKSKGNVVIATIPTIRIDLKTQEDIIEEIGRIYGYEKIKSKALTAEIQAAKIGDLRKLERKLKNILVGFGFSEVYNYSFYGEKDVAICSLSQNQHFELENPMNPDQLFLRTSLVPNILKNVKENLKNFKELEVFEIGKTYFQEGEVLPKEKIMLVGAVATEENDNASGFYEAKGYIEGLFSKLGISEVGFSVEEIPQMFHPVRTANIKKEERIIGIIGEITPLVLEGYGIKKRITIFEFDIEILLENSLKNREFALIRKYPVSNRDISMIAKSEIVVDDIIKNIQKSGGNLVLNIELFDVFNFKEKNETSFAFRISFGSEDRTLRNEEVEEIMEKVIENLEKELKVKVRK